MPFSSGRKTAPAMRNDGMTPAYRHLVDVLWRHVKQAANSSAFKASGDLSTHDDQCAMAGVQSLK